MTDEKNKSVDAMPISTSAEPLKILATKPGLGIPKGPSKDTQEKEKPTVLESHGYQLGRNVGSGSYATVKEAYSRRHKCRVAIKIISKKKAPDDYLQKFLPREIEVVKLVKHPNLVVFLQAIETNNRVYLVMEYATGGDLLDTIRKHKFLPEKQAAVWFGQLVDAIDYCHSRGVVHRDLKCENILLDEYKNIKVTDFGFAKANMMPKPGEKILSETYCGSYAYAPMEILTGTPYVAQFADIWSIGVVLYVMLMGRLPFDDSNHRKLLKEVYHGPTFSDDVELSASCKDLITKILIKMPNRLTISGVRSHEWFKVNCQPILDLVQQESDKYIALKASPVNENRNNANEEIPRHNDCRNGLKTSVALCHNVAKTTVSMLAANNSRHNVQMRKIASSAYAVGSLPQITKYDCFRNIPNQLNMSNCVQNTLENSKMALNPFKKSDLPKTSSRGDLSWHEFRPQTLPLKKSVYRLKTLKFKSEDIQKKSESKEKSLPSLINIKADNKADKSMSSMKKLVNRVLPPLGRMFEYG